MKILLYCPPKETLGAEESRLMRKYRLVLIIKRFRGCKSHLAALTCDAAVMVAGGLVPAYHTWLIFLQVAGNIPWNRDDLH